MKSLVTVNLLLIVVFLINVDCGSRRSNSYYEESYAESDSDLDHTPSRRLQSCNFEIAAAIGALYVYSNPVKDQSEIQAFVNQYDYLLGADSDVIRCMRKLGNLFIQQGYTQFNFSAADENRVRSSVYGMTAGSGLDGVNIADNITGSMRSESLQPIVIGQELLWLSEVIPEAADNNWYRYKNTGTYFRQAAIEHTAQINAVLELYGAFDPEMKELMNAIMPGVNQWIDQYGMWYIISSGVYLGVFE